MDILIQRWSESTKAIVIRANDEVRKYQNTFFKPEHVLLGLLRQTDASTEKILQNKSIDPSVLNRVLRKALKRGKKVYPELDIGVQIAIPFSKKAKQLFSLAVEEFKKSKDKQLEPKHILLGILKLDYRPLRQVLRVSKAKTGPI